MVLEFLWSGIYLLLIAGGLLAVLEARSYDMEHRLAAPQLWRTYLTAAATAAFIGVVGLAWTLVDDPGLWVHTVTVGTFAILLPVVQSRMHAEMGVDRSPLWARFD